MTVTRTSLMSMLSLFYDSENWSKDEPSWKPMLRLIREEAMLRKEAGWLHQFGGASYRPVYGGGYIGFNIKFK